MYSGGGGRKTRRAAETSFGRSWLGGTEIGGTEIGGTEIGGTEIGGIGNTLEIVVRTGAGFRGGRLARHNAYMSKKIADTNKKYRSIFDKPGLGFQF
jgi:hypothetical protein